MESLEDGESESWLFEQEMEWSGMSGQSRLYVVPCELDEANAFVKRHHRHHHPVIGHKFSIAVADELDVIRGVAIVGRPASRMLQDGWTLDVNRCATDGCPNACSALYSAAWRAVRALGYRRCGTYILNTESGVSLVAAGWKLIGECGGGSWSRKDRPRVDKHPLQGKLRWEASAATNQEQEP
jgi:hypothetical protein